MTTIVVTNAITSLREAESRFNLERIEDLRFFQEWQIELPKLQQVEIEALDRIKRGYLYKRADGYLTAESTVNLLLTSPLMYLAGLCDPPFKLQAEKSIEISLESENTVLKGRIDALVLSAQFWLVLLESKQTKFSFTVGIPQALAYMMASQNVNKPIFGLVTNGDNFIFIKLVKSASNGLAGKAQFDLSDDYSMYARTQNELYQVLQIMKQIAQLID